jgi:hypothetical protein
MASSSRGIVMHFEFWIGRTILAQSIDPSSLLLMRDASQPQTVNASAVLRANARDSAPRDELASSQYACGNIRTPMRVLLSKRSCAAGATWIHSMTTLTLLGVATILSTTLATPVLAQAVIQEPGAYAFYRPNGDLGIRSAPPQQREVVIVVGRGTADAVALD